MIKTQIENDLILAMKEKNEVAKTTLRAVKAGFINELVASGKTPQCEVTDEMALNVIKKEVKKRKDAYEQFTKGQRSDLAENEKNEIAVLQKYLPEMMSLEEVKKVAILKKAELKIEDKSKMGILIGSLMKDLKDKADGSDVKKIVEALFD